MFISSVIDGLEDERQAVAEAVREVGAEPVWFEEFGGRDQDPEQAYRSEVAASDIYVGILGTYYGRQDPQRGYSPTHAEYLHAIEQGLRISVWVLDVDDMAGHQRAFLEEVRTYFTTETVPSPDRLARRVVARLKAIAAEDLSSWCKIDNVVFRAQQIREDATTITVTAGVPDDDVAHALTDLRPGFPTTSRPVLVVFADTATTARPDSVETTTTAGATRQMTITLTREDRHRTRGSALQGFSYSTGDRTYSPDDLTEIALRKVLFNEPSPLDDRMMPVNIKDPVEPLRQAGVSEERLRPVLRLLLVEGLVGSGRASRITGLRVGPATSGDRRLHLEWQPPSRHGQATQPRAVDGRLHL